MGFVEATKTCLKKYVTLKGRASRSEFWYFYLFTILVSIAAAIVDTLLFGVSLDNTGGLETIVSLAFIIPTITATVRRLHDIGRAGYYIFLPIICIVAGMLLGSLFGTVLPILAVILTAIVAFSGLILQLYWLVKKSEPGSNEYGPNPLEGPTTEHLKEVFE